MELIMKIKAWIVNKLSKVEKFVVALLFNTMMAIVIMTIAIFTSVLVLVKGEEAGAEALFAMSGTFLKSYEGGTL